MTFPAFAQWTTDAGQNTIHTDNGNVGIRTNTPSALLSLGGGVGNKKLFVYDDGANASGLAQGFSEFRIFGIASGTDHISFGKYALSNDLFTEQLRLSNEGNLGVGIFAPQDRLHVYSSNQNMMTTGLRLTGGDGGGSSGVSMLFTSAYSNGSWFSGRIGAMTTGYGTNYGSALIFQTNNGSTTNSLIEQMRITQSGNVGICTSSPDTKLAVNGTIHSREVKVDVNFPAPDYVFKPVYRLRPLHDLAAYIKKNQHLPEIPSAKVIEKDGVNLSEMNMKLLQKVEELTLYVIAQQRQLDTQRKELAELKLSKKRYIVK